MDHKNDLIVIEIFPYTRYKDEGVFQLAFNFYLENNPKAVKENMFVLRIEYEKTPIWSVIECLKEDIEDVSFDCAQKQIKEKFGVVIDRKNIDILYVEPLKDKEVMN